MLEGCAPPACPPAGRYQRPRVNRGGVLSAVPVYRGHRLSNSCIDGPDEGRGTCSLHASRPSGRGLGVVVALRDRNNWNMALARLENGIVFNRDKCKVALVPAAPESALGVLGAQQISAGPPFPPPVRITV